jgi:hypothetical protein
MTLTERNLGNLRDPIVPEGGELKWPQLPLSWGFYVSPDKVRRRTYQGDLRMEG